MLHSELALLLEFFSTCRANPPPAFNHGQTVIAGQPEFFNIRSFQACLNNPLLTPEWLGIVKNGQQVPLEPFALWKTVQTRRLMFLDKTAINAELRAGAAAVLEGVDILDPAINEFAGHLDRLLPCALVNSVAFFSQSGNEAYRGHRDSDDVLVIQLSGEKTWDLFAPQQRRYFNNSPLTRAQMGEQIAKVVMKPGDALYVRAGVPHMCHTTGNHSLHMSFDLCDRTPNVEQIGMAASEIYNNASEEPYVPVADVIGRYARVLGDDAFVKAMDSMTGKIRDDAGKFRQRISGASGVTALNNYIR